MLSQRVWLVAGAVSLACGGSRSSADEVAAAAPDLTGRWVLNEELSEDPREMAQQGRAGRGGPPPGGGKGGGRGRFSQADRERMQQTMRMIRRASLAFTVVQTDTTVMIVSDEPVSLLLYPDGRKIVTEVRDVGEVELKTKWDDNELVVERKLESGAKIKTRYELAEGGEQLWVTVEASGGPIPFPIKFRRVYDAQP